MIPFDIFPQPYQMRLGTPKETRQCMDLYGSMITHTQCSSPSQLHHRTWATVVEANWTIIQLTHRLVRLCAAVSLRVPASSCMKAPSADQGCVQVGLNRLCTPIRFPEHAEIVSR